MVPNAILIPPRAAFTAILYTREIAEGPSGARARKRASVCRCADTYTRFREGGERARGTEVDRRRDGEVLLRFAKNADRGVIIYICRTARGPQAIRRHVDTQARASRRRHESNL